MGLAGYAIDKVVSTSVDIAKGMLIPAYVFPPVTPIGIFMPTGTGGPGTIAEGARSFLDGSDQLANARDQLSALCAGLTSSDWSGDDRTLFDKTVADLGDQLDIASTYARVVGACLAGVAVPLGAYGGVCIGIGGVLMTEALIFEAAVASVVGNLGPSEAAYAAGCATAGTCLAVLAGVLAGYAALMEAAAAVIGIGGLVDAKKQSDHGDSSAINNYKDAQVDGLAEAGENLEKWAVAVGTEFITRGRGPAGQSVAQRMERGADLAGKVGDYNDAAWDLIHGDPLQAAEDLTGYGAEIDEVEDLFSDDEVPNDHTDRHYSLPPTPPPSQAPPPPPPPPPAPTPPWDISPIPPADGGPHVIPLPPADDDDPGIIPAGVDINGGTPVGKGQQV